MTATTTTPAPGRARRDSEYRRRRRLGWYWALPTVLAAVALVVVEVGVPGFSVADRLVLTLAALGGVGWLAWRWWHAWAGARRYHQEVGRMAREHPGRSPAPAAAPPATLGVAATAAITWVDAERIEVRWNGQVVGTWTPGAVVDVDPERLLPGVVGWDGPVPVAAVADRFSEDAFGFSSGTIVGVPYLWCERRRLLVDASGREWALDALLGGGRTPGRALRDGITELPAELGPYGAVFVLTAALHVRRARYAAWLRAGDSDSNWATVLDW